MRVLERPNAFLTELSDSRPRVALVYLPPATPGLITAVAAHRRRRTALRCVLVNELQGVDDRLHALAAGFDEALAVVGHRRGADRTPGHPGAIAAQRAGTTWRLATVRSWTSRPISSCAMGARSTCGPRSSASSRPSRRHPGRAHSRAQLLDRVWGPDRAGDPRTVDVHIRWLRAKVEPNPDKPVHLVTVRGTGYRLDPDGRGA